MRWESICFSQVGLLTAGDAAYVPKSFSSVREPLTFLLTGDTSASYTWLKPWFVFKQFVNCTTVRVLLKGVRFSMQLCCQWDFFACKSLLLNFSLE